MVTLFNRIRPAQHSTERSSEASASPEHDAHGKSKVQSVLTRNLLFSRADETRRNILSSSLSIDYYCYYNIVIVVFKMMMLLIWDIKSRYGTTGAAEMKTLFSVFMSKDDKDAHRIKTSLHDIQVPGSRPGILRVQRKI